jgi:hypothetical protein
MSCSNDSYLHFDLLFSLHRRSDYNDLACGYPLRIGGTISVQHLISRVTCDYAGHYKGKVE